MSFIPAVECIQFFHPALPARSISARTVTDPERAAKLREIAEQNIMEAARLHLRLNGIEATPETLEAERAEMARLRQKYSSR